MAKIDSLELAWAAGFFDGEGSTTLYPKSRKSMDYVRQPTLSINQLSKGTLLRFQGAVLGMGRIYGPYSRRKGATRPIYLWRATRWLESQAVIALLWRFLTPEKQGQALRCFAAYKAGIGTGRLCRNGLHPKPRRYGKCKECAAEAIRRWRKRPGVAEHLLEYQRRYRREHPEWAAKWVAINRERRRAARQSGSGT